MVCRQVSLSRCAKRNIVWLTLGKSFIRTAYAIQLSPILWLLQILPWRRPQLFLVDGQDSGILNPVTQDKWWIFRNVWTFGGKIWASWFVLTTKYYYMNQHYYVNQIKEDMGRACSILRHMRNVYQISEGKVSLIKPTHRRDKKSKFGLKELEWDCMGKINVGPVNSTNNLRIPQNTINYFLTVGLISQGPLGHRDSEILNLLLVWTFIWWSRICVPTQEKQSVYTIRNQKRILQDWISSE
jgi:hypothetical protein